MLFNPADVVALTSSQVRLRDEFNQRIRSGLLKNVKCLCGSADMEQLSDTDRYQLLQPLAICRNCGLIQLNPRMSEMDYQWFYSSDCYRLLYDGDDFVTDNSAKFTPQHGQRMLWAIKRAGAPLRSVVEIGAGGGWNLVAFKNEGVEVCGWDYSEKLVATGNRYGIRMKCGSIKDAVADGIRYDAVIFNHVLEHLLDPVRDLRALHALLNPGGTLYVGVPAIDYPAMGLLQNAHTYYFTDKTLAHYMAISGWVVGPIVHEDKFGMHTVARAGSAEPVTLATEYRDLLSRLRSRRWHAHFLERWYKARMAMGRVLDALGLYIVFRTIYRRLRA